jgi:glucose-6-phosphate dehydrogenase assembly protein OpcA
MAQDVTGIERIGGGPISVRPDAIEDEFNRIWTESARAGMDESSVRLRVLNFVGIGCTDEGALDRFERVMDALPAHHPCRGILAVTSPGAEGVEASIAAHCWISGGGSRHLCSEEVVLRAAPGQERALASAVLALLVPEVPVAGWVIGEPDLESGLVSEIIDAADRLFIDSSRAPDLVATLNAVLDIRQQHDVDVCDLAWSRLQTWRALVAQFFDHDDALRELARLQAIDIVSGSERPSAEAMLLAGWLVSRLGLLLADLSQHDAGVDATLYDATRGVRLSISCEGRRRPAVREVRIRTQGAAFLVQAHEESGHLHVREEWPENESRRTVAPRAEDDASVFAEVLDGGDDPGVFLDAARSALSLMGQSMDDVTGSPARPA